MAKLSEEFQKRAEEKPDEWTLAWWNKRFEEILSGYRGATHSVNRVIDEYADHYQAVKELRERCDSLKEEIAANKARIGEVQSAFTQLTERVGRMAEFLNKLREERKNGGSDK